MWLGSMEVECGGKSVEVRVEVRVWRWEGVVREYGGGSVEVGVWR